MEILKDPARYARVMTKRAWRRAFTEDRRRSIARAGVVARNGVLFVGATIGVSAAYIEADLPLPQKYRWATVTYRECISGVFASIHSVKPDEEIFLSIRPHMDNNPEPGVTFDLSDRTLAMGSYQFCFEEGQIADAGIIFQARNGRIFGEKEIYNPQMP